MPTTGSNEPSRFRRQGGGIFNVSFFEPDVIGQVTLTNSTVARNRATQAGGGIGQGDESFIVLTNSLVAQTARPRGPTCSMEMLTVRSVRAST